MSSDEEYERREVQRPSWASPGASRRGSHQAMTSAATAASSSSVDVGRGGASTSNGPNRSEHEHRQRERQRRQLPVSVLRENQPRLRREAQPEPPQRSPGASSLTGEVDVWDALTHIFADMDNQGGAGDEQDALAETLDSLRGLLDMHIRLKQKTVGLRVKNKEMAKERDAALERLAELEKTEARERSTQHAWGAYAYAEDEQPTQQRRQRRR